MQPYLISVIVPVYNVERYLEQCLHSILSQSYKNIEVILVDDGSTDNSGKICDEYAAKDSRIKVMHQQISGGVASARNAALSVAHGEYIGFVDADDWIATNMYDTLLKFAKSYTADIVMGNTIDVLHSGKTQYMPMLSAAIKHIKCEEFWKLFIQHGTCKTLWNKLFTRKILENIRFDTSFVRASDVNFLLEVLKRSPTIIYIPQNVYYYRHNSNSITKQKKISYWKSEMRLWNNIRQTLPPALWKFAVSPYLTRLYTLCILIILQDRTDKYEVDLKGLIQTCKLYKNSLNQLNNKGLRWFAYCFINCPNFTIHLLRLPCIRKICILLL